MITKKLEYIGVTWNTAGKISKIKENRIINSSTEWKLDLQVKTAKRSKDTDDDEDDQYFCAYPAIIFQRTNNKRILEIEWEI